MTSEEADEILEKLDHAGLSAKMEPIRDDGPYNSRIVGWKLSVESVAGWRTTAVEQLVEALLGDENP